MGNHNGPLVPAPGFDKTREKKKASQKDIVSFSSKIKRRCKLPSLAESKSIYTCISYHQPPQDASVGMDVTVTRVTLTSKVGVWHRL